MKKILLLGATGSIGQSTLAAVRRHPGRFAVTGMVAHGSVDELAAAAREFRPRRVALADPEKAAELARILADTDVLAGDAGVLELVRECEADICVSAIVGAAGLRPTLAAIGRGLDIALANKEALVAAGSIVTARARQTGSTILPVDSEHSALAQCLRGTERAEVSRLVLTASGGPFRGKSLDELELVTPEAALEHPTWTMGAKVTVDSASLANKALEIIEAHWLFDMPYDRMDILVHPQSAVHSLVEFVDGTYLAQLARPEMQIPILQALSWPERLAPALAPMDFTQPLSLTFEPPDREAFPMLELGLAAGRRGGTAPAAYSAANEEAVALFLERRIRFPQIAAVVRDAVAAHTFAQTPDLETIFAVEAAVRARIRRRYA